MIWKDIEGYEGKYAISSCGQVKSLKRSKILIGDINSAGYRRIVLSNPTSRMFVHRLVAYHFVDGFNEELVVNHKDGNKLNNDFSNLEWVTRSENDLHAFDLGLRRLSNPPKKVIHYDPKDNSVIAIYNSAKEASEKLNLPKSSITSNCNGAFKHCRGNYFKYED